MTTLADIIQAAYRESNLVAISATPTAEQTNEGLAALQRLIASVYGQELSDAFTDMDIGKNNVVKPSGFPGYDPTPDIMDWFVPPNVRLVLNLTEALTVYLDPIPQDGARFSYRDSSGNLATNNFTVHANGRSIGGAVSLTVSTNGDSADYFYRADLGDWVKVTDLGLQDDLPFPREFEDMFIIGLAIRLNPRYQVIADPQTATAYKRASRQFKARYNQVVPQNSELALLRIPGVKYRFYNTNTPYSYYSFDRGVPQ